jgi:HK97 family phage major capsid protein
MKTMDIKELLKTARSLLEEANQAVEEDNLELAQEKREEAMAIQEKAKAIKAQQDLSDELDELEPEEKPVKSEPIRPPFETADDDGEEETENSFDQPFYVTKYGKMDAAQKAVTKDLYGPNYFQMRDDQIHAFAKYIRTGWLSSKEEALLKQIILVPDAISAQIKGGFSVADIKATLQEGINDLGGFLVPEDFRLEIIKRLMGLTIVRGRARVVQTIRDAAEWPKLEGGNSRYTSAVRVTWVDELPGSATAAETNPTFGMLRVPVHTVMARTDVSQNMLEDTPFNMLQVLAELFSEAMAIDEDEKFLIGVGGGSPRGILGNRSGAEETPEDGIESVNSGAAAAVTADGLIDLVYGLHAQYRGNAGMFGARATHRDVRKLKDGAGDYLWQPGIKAGEPPTLLGYPFLESEAMPAIGANKYPIVFGDLKGYLIVDRVGMSVKRVEDTTTVGGNKVALFARRRLGGQVIEPWRYQSLKIAA